LQQSQVSQPDLQHAMSPLQQPQQLPARREMLPTSSVANNPSVINPYFIAILLFLKSGTDRNFVESAPDFRSGELYGTGRSRTHPSGDL